MSDEFRCEAHPDRWGRLTVDLPSIGCKRYMCAECREAFIKSMDSHTSARQSARNGFSPWQWEMTPSGRSYITDHAYLNPNAIYERGQRNGERDE